MTAPDQTIVFRRLRRSLAANGLRSMLETGRIRLYTMVGTSFFVAAFVFGLSAFGFLELFGFKIPTKGLIVAGLFDLMFFTLGVMLLFSTGIILYASLFVSSETRFLLTTPARADRIFAAKFQDAVLFSSWGFVVLGMPVLVAYGMTAGVPLYFYPLLPLFLLGFVLLPGSVSAIACLLFMRYLPRNRKQVLAVAGTILLTLLAYWIARTTSASRSALLENNRDALESFIGQFKLARNPIAPSHWMTSGLMEAARGESVRGVLLPLALLWSNGLLAFLLAAIAARRLYRTAYDRAAAGGGGRQKRYRGNILDRAMEGLVFYLDRPTRVLVVKDFRTFRRDPAQWAILVIFAALMLLGVRNFNLFSNADIQGIDRFIISFVNLSGVAVLLCAGLSRFIYPLISLEGRKFWILGLMPVSRRQILVGKFAFAATGATAIGLVLVVGSELLLGLSVEGVLVHALTIVAVSVGLSGMNVGLGACLPNFRETDPSKIVVGFGGTVNMVAGLGFVVATVSLMALPLHVAATLRHFKSLDFIVFPGWVFAGIPVGLALATAATILPLRAGTRAMERVEF
jgi:ABC-2 type transport system permease protein